MDNIPLFGRRKNGEVARSSTRTPSSPSVLAETYGIFVYQEQVMQAAQPARRLLAG